MAAKYRSRRARLAALSESLRAQGQTWAQIARRIAADENVNMRVAFRLAHGMSQREVAARWNELFPAATGTAGISDKIISYWETWPESGYEPSLKSLKRLARIYQCGIGDLIDGGDFSYLDTAASGTRALRDATDAGRMAGRAGQASDGNRQAAMAAGNLFPQVEFAEADEVNRRALLRILGLGAPGALLPAPSKVLEALHITSDGGSDLDAASAELSRLIAHYSHVVAVAPSPAVYGDLLGVRSFAGALLGRSGPGPDARRAGLIATAGWFSSLLAISATDLGDHAAALVWCADTERRGQQAGHPELLGWASLTRAVLAYYQGQAHRSADLACHGQAVTRPGTVVHAKLAAQEMRAQAMLGDAEGMADARRRASSAMERLTPGAATTGAFSIPRADQPPYTATSLLLVKKYQDAADTTRRLLETVYRSHAKAPGDQPTNYARTLLILALAEAGLGRIDAAAAAGGRALDCGRLVWPTMVLAGKLDHSLAYRSAKSAGTAGYHARYLDAAERLGQPLTSARARPELT